MWAPHSAAGEVAGFELCYSITKCCFNGPPKVQHFVKATVRSSRVGYHSGSVNVVGTLHVGVEQGDGRVQSVYRIDVEKVDPA